MNATDDGVFVFTRPNGRPVAERGASFRGNILGGSRQTLKNATFEETLQLYTLNRERGLEIDAHTSRCRWTGESMDYSQAIECMQDLSEHAGTAAQRLE